MIRETTIFKEWLDQRYNEGRVDGEISGKQRLLKKQLERKFGPLSQELKKQLQELDVEQLDLLAMDFLDLATVDDLQAWLMRETASIHLN